MQRARAYSCVGPTAKPCRRLQSHEMSVNRLFAAGERRIRSQGILIWTMSLTMRRKVLLMRLEREMPLSVGSPKLATSKRMAQQFAWESWLNSKTAFASCWRTMGLLCHADLVSLICCACGDRIRKRWRREHLRTLYAGSSCTVRSMKFRIRGGYEGKAMEQQEEKKAEASAAARLQKKISYRC